MVMGELEQETELLVIGAGPGGYSAAFRAADLGMDVTLVDSEAKPGGVCLHRGCIPSKALLQVAELLHDSGRSNDMGLRFARPEIDLSKMRQWKDGIVNNMSNGLIALSRKRGVQLLQGRAEFENDRTIRLVDSEVNRIHFQHAVVATGSYPLFYPGLQSEPTDRIMTSTEALRLGEVPDTLLVIGGGYIGLELGTVYAALGSKVTVVEVGQRLLSGVDGDLVRVLLKRLQSDFAAVKLNTRVVKLEEATSSVLTVLEDANGRSEHRFDRALVAIGRGPNTSNLGLNHAGIEVDDKGFIRVDDQMRTKNPVVYAIGDVTGGTMLAHKASFQGKMVAEIIAGMPAAYDVRAMPAVIFTDPQIAWAGAIEDDLSQEGRDVEVRRFPWKLSGRAHIVGSPDGLTKMIVERSTRRIIGVGIAGRHAENLISEAVLAIEMGALADDVALSVHPHPTLSETESEVADIFLGSATHMLNTQTLK